MSLKNTMNLYMVNQDESLKDIAKHLSLTQPKSKEKG